MAVCSVFDSGRWEPSHWGESHKPTKKLRELLDALIRFCEHDAYFLAGLAFRPRLLVSENTAHVFVGGGRPGTGG
jgi:hypothetical protein